MDEQVLVLLRGTDILAHLNLNEADITRTGYFVCNNKQRVIIFLIILFYLVLSKKWNKCRKHPGKIVNIRSDCNRIRYLKY